MAERSYFETPPRVGTAAPADNSEKAASTAYVDAAVAGGGSYTDEQAQDAVGAMVDGTTLEYVDATPLLRVKDSGITLAKVQNIATARILGRDTAGSGIVEELTAAEVLTMLGGSPGGGGSAVGYLRSFDGIADPINDNFAGVAGALDTSGTGNRFTGSTPWTWDAQAAATGAIYRNKLRLDIAASTGGFHMIYQTAPSGEWVIRAQIGYPLAFSTSTKFAGIFLKDSVGGRIEAWGWGISPTGIIWASKWTNMTTFSASRLSAAQTTSHTIPKLWEIEKTATNYILRYGDQDCGMIDGANFAHTDFLANVADRIGLFVYSDNAAGSSARMDVEEFYRVA